MTDSIVDTLASEDVLHRFMLEKAGVRGVLVRLGASWHEIASRADYPSGLRDTLGQAVAASALLTGNIKFEGSLSLEFKSQGPLHLLFTECTDKGRLRGLARYDAQALPASVDLGRLPEAMLAITIGHAERGRYQGVVELDENASIGEALENYFERSEQLPARILLAADGKHAVGLMLQPIPGEGGHSAADDDDDDAWARVGHLTATLSASEMLATRPEELLYRLYHEETVRLYDPKPLAFGCTCSQERVEGMLRALGRDEVEATLVDRGGEIEVICEFCATRYVFDRVDAERLLTQVETPPSPSTLQ